MSTSSRRGFLALSATGVAVAAVAPVAMAAVQSGPSQGSADGPLVAYISNPSTGEISLLTGEREVVVSDPELVRKLTAHL